MHFNNNENLQSNSGDAVSVNQRELPLFHCDDNNQVAEVTISRANSLPTPMTKDNNETTMGKALLRNNSYSTVRSYDSIIKIPDYQHFCNKSTANSDDGGNVGDGKKSIKTTVSEGLRTQYVLGGKASLNTIIICTYVGVCLTCIDASIVSIVMSQIGTEFENANLSTWIHSAYTLATLVTMPLVGKLSDIFGRKIVMILINSLFLIGSIGCGTAQSFNQLILARIIAGLGGGGLTLMANIIIHDLVPLHQRSQYQSYVGAIQTLGVALGSSIGGLITDTIGWRYCFKINILPFIWILYIFIFHLDNYNAPLTADKLGEKLCSVDFTGAALVAFANVALATGLLLGGNTHDWNSFLIISLIAFSIVTFLLFGFHQVCWAKNPIISPTIAANKNVCGASACMLFICIASSATICLVPQFFMGILKFTTSKAGFWSMAEAFPIPLGCSVAGQYIRYTNRFRNYSIVSSGFYAVALYWISKWMILSVPFTVGIISIGSEGFFAGSAIVGSVIAVGTDIPQEEISSAMVVLTMCRFMGNLMGPAVSSAIVQSNLKSLLLGRIDGPKAQELIHFIRTSIMNVHTLEPEIQEIVRDVLSKSLEKAFLAMSGFAVIAMISATLQKNISI
ncbi:major facilitator superfamily domain-containing protein [Circinella umbellata]|nr:major facilitator superfamily domain-containing protein [Circinella umbellata]